MKHLLGFVSKSLVSNVTLLVISVCAGLIVEMGSRLLDCNKCFWRKKRYAENQHEDEK